MMSPAYDSMQQQQQSYGWGQGSNFSDNRQPNTRTKPHWGSGKRRQQNNPMPVECPPSPQSPAGLPRSPVAGYQEPDVPTVVKLENLPHALCRQALLEAMLEQAGLTGSMLGCVLGQDQDTGNALVYLSSGRAAQMCMDHFSGCCWDKGGSPVRARVMDAPPPPAQTPPVSFTDLADRAPGGMLQKPQMMMQSPVVDPCRSPMGNMSPMGMQSPCHGIPMSPMALPMVMPTWGDFVPTELPAGFDQNIFAKPEMPSEESNEGSTVPGSRTSCDTMPGGSDGFDTDDGF